MIIIKSIIRLYLMIQVNTNIYNHLQLFIANLIFLANTLTPNLKQIIT